MNPNDYRAARRPEKKHEGRWGLWSAREDRWLDLTFSSEREANDALDYLRKHGNGKDKP